MEIRERVLNALYAALESTSNSSNNILSLLGIISRRYVFTFMSSNVITAVLNEIYTSNKQDDYLEFISEFHNSLNLEGFTNTDLLNMGLSSAELFYNSPITKEIICKTNGGVIDNIDRSGNVSSSLDVFTAVLFILRLNVKYAYNYLYKKESDNA